MTHSLKTEIKKQALAKSDGPYGLLLPGTEKCVTSLLKDHLFIYPASPVTLIFSSHSLILNNFQDGNPIKVEPYQNRAITGVIGAVLAQTKLLTKFPNRFKTSCPEDLDRQEDEAPIVLVSIAATGVRASPFPVCVIIDTSFIPRLKLSF